MRLLIVLAIAAIFYLIQKIVYKKFWVKGLKVKVSFNDTLIREGDKSKLNIEIGNDKALLIPIIQVKFAISRTFLFKKEMNASVTDQYYRNEYFTLAPYQKITRQYSFIASKRGEYKLSYLDLICKDIFINKNMYAEYKNNSSIIVLPKRIDPRYIPSDVVRMAGEIITNIKTMEDPFEFNSIRDYQPYDLMNHINWKATARLDELQVNTFDSTNQKNIMILLNLDPNSFRNPEIILEESIRIAASLANYFITKNMQVGLVTNGKDYETKEIVKIEPGSDYGHIRNIEIALARIGNEPVQPFVKFMNDNIDEENKSFEYVIISNYRKDDFMERYNYFKEQGLLMSLIVPELDYIPVENLGSPREVVWEVAVEN